MGTVSELIERLDSNEQRRGKQFEHICQWFLTSDPVFRKQLRRVWLWDEWPGRWGADAGIDLIAEEHDGRLWAIQAKAYDSAYSVTKADVDTFLSESARPEFAFRLLIATTDRIGKTAERTLQARRSPPVVCCWPTCGPLRSPGHDPRRTSGRRSLDPNGPVPISARPSRPSCEDPSQPTAAR